MYIYIERERGILAGNNSSFHVKKRTAGKVQFLFFRRFLIVLTKLSFEEVLSARQ